MRFPNSYGSVQLVCSKKEKSKRRKPYRVRITKGWSVDEKQEKFDPNNIYKSTQQFETIGYARTKKEGQQMLAEYYNEPYNLDMNNFTFNDLYKQWHDYKMKTNITERTKKKYESLVKHYSPIENKVFSEIKLIDLQTIIDKSNCTHDYQIKIIGIYKQMHKYAKAVNMKVGNDVSLLVVYTPHIKPTLHQPFTDEEIELLWNNRNETIDMVLINIYTGLRPGEFFEISEVHDNCFITGSKTEAGRNRIIPLHDKIKEMFHETYKSGILKEISNEDRYYHRFKRKMLEIGLKNTPYSARHTFATLMHRARANELVTKVIMGHKSNDITKDVYTHTNVEELITEVNKI